MHIVHIATELSPIAKAGGLGDVVYGLSKALCKLGHTVEIILPKYDCLDWNSLKNPQVEVASLTCLDGSYSINNTIWSAKIQDLTVHFIESEHPEAFFSRGVIYGCSDDTIRFAYFSKVAMEYLFKSGKAIDLIHVHDWPTSLVPALYQEIYRPLGYSIKGTVLTIHNLEHQGISSPEQLTRMGIHKYAVQDKLRDQRRPDLINFLKGGIEYADQVVTVSPRYEKEILTPEGGCSLQSLLLQHREKLQGVLNGIDEEYWNPQTDPYLLKNYPSRPILSKEKLHQVLLAKRDNRRHLRRYLNLEESPAPIVASITRLVPQKSPELIAYALRRTLAKGGQFILLGSYPSPEVTALFQELYREFHGHASAAILLNQDEALAHLIFAASDLFVMPSLFEPCGLTQLIAQRYGTIPLARMTGGLVDTVFDVETSSKPQEERNGFTFDYPDIEGVNWALDRALHCFTHDPTTWHRLIQNGMNKDWSWKAEAPRYVAIYKKLKN